MTRWAKVREAMRDVALAAMCAAVLGGPAAVHVGAQTPQPAQTTPATKPAPAAQDGFVPVSELPPVAEMPAGPLVLGAYAFIWGVVLVYVFSIGRRLSAVQRDVDRLKQQGRRS